MSSENLLSSEVLICFKNDLPKADKEKENDLRTFLGTRNTVIHKIEYVTL